MRRQPTAPGQPTTSLLRHDHILQHPATQRRLHRPIVTAQAQEPIRNADRRRGYLRVTLTSTDEGYRARLTGTQSSGVLRSMVAADGLAIVPGATTIPLGQAVKVLLLRPTL